MLSRVHFAGLVIASLIAAVCVAGTLETRFTTVLIKDLPVGHCTLLRLPDGEKYGVENKTGQTVEMVFSAVMPTQIEPATPPWQSIPAIEWISISPLRVKAKSGRKAQTDVTISVPDDPALAGKNYEFWLRATTEGQIGVSLVSRVRFNTVSNATPERTQ